MKQYIASWFLFLFSCNIFGFQCAELEDNLDEESLKIYDNLLFVFEDIFPSETELPKDEVSENLPRKRYKKGNEADLHYSEILSGVNPEQVALFNSFKNRLEKISFIRSLVLEKYRNALGPKYSNVNHIIWSKIDILGWPDQINTYDIHDLSKEQCAILLRHLPQIRFEAKIKDKVQRNPKPENEALYNSLKEALAPFPKFFKKSGIRWRKLHKVLPDLKLKTHDYRVWSSDDRFTIESVLLASLRDSKENFM